MEGRHRCKLCFRNFANGRALGGHMRSHMMKYYAAKKRKEEEFEEQEQPFDDFQSFYSCSSPSSSSSSSSSSSDEEDGEEEDEVKALLSYELRENPRKSALLVDHDFSFTAAAAASVVLEDGESETESSKKNPICRRSKRVRKSRISDFNGFGSNGFGFPAKKSKFDCEYSSLSSISDTTPEEHVAHCLIMLSKDNWRREEKIEFPEEEEGNGKKFVDDYREEDYNKAIKTTKVRGKYRCEECNKLFKSYQALGGHRASHKKIKPVAPPRAAEKRAVVVVEEKIHACPFCDRVFSSGQALGGHKRSHFIGGGVISANAGNITQAIKQDSRTDNGETLNIDLNLPAPVEDDETTSQIAISAVSDAEFVHPIK